MMNKKKISITAVLLAVMMMCLMPVRIFAADKKNCFCCGCLN